MNDSYFNLSEMLSDLPLHLAERTRLRSAGRTGQRGSLVVYWTHHALRCDENPALDVAICLSNRLKLPLLVYQGLSEKYRFASDRHHTFILEAARELQAKYFQRGIAYALHVEREGHRIPRLAQLTHGAAVIVTDDFPVEATKRWTERLSAGRAAVISVDTACVVPMRLVGKAYDRAFEFRAATATLYSERLDRSWPECETPKIPATDLPFASLDIGEKSIAQIVAQCSIVHAVGPVSDTRGGESGGYARWNAFRRNRLATYESRRNSIEVDGVSRMSAYLHYGMVSPMRIAREASSEGAEKFLDELLIWRELAYAFCFYHGDVDSDAALPQWAIETLTQHATDTRIVMSWERLARARTGQRLWDAAQRSLIKHGELHNNVRMTWGKAILQWSAGYRDALKRLIDLNHRFALDGRDPASYGGILWCLGQFDRPFQPEQPVFGSVRTRPIEFHQHRTKIERYEKIVDRPAYSGAPSIAIIGAGVGGLLCGRTLADHGLAVKYFEKSSRPGGRAATRVVNGEFQFDHGAQYFTIRDERLKPLIESWYADRIVDVWKGRIVEVSETGGFREVPPLLRYVGTPKMNSVGEHLARDQDIRFKTQVSRIERNGNGYKLFDQGDRELGAFDVVIWNCPPKQVAALVPMACEWRERLSMAEMLPCWAVVLMCQSRWQVQFDGAFVNHGKLSWIARDSSKPLRTNSTEIYVLHSSVPWATENLETTQDKVIEELSQEAERVSGAQLPVNTISQAHRWLYAKPNQSLPESSLWDQANRLGACGDWCGGPRVEGAMLSGLSLAGRVLGSLHEQSVANERSSPILPSERQMRLF